MTGKIQKLLDAKSIYKYNITHQHQKGLLFKFSNGNISSETKNINQLIVSFEKDNKISEFSISNNYDTNKINQIIDLCLENMSTGKLKQSENKNKSTNLKAVYDKFNSKNYITWLQDEINLLLKNLDFSFNFVYTTDISKSICTSQSGCNTLYECSSTCGIMDNSSFNHNAFINNYFINSDLSKSLISKIEN